MDKTLEKDFLNDLNRKIFVVDTSVLLYDKNSIFNMNGNYNTHSKYLFTSSRRSYICTVLYRWHIAVCISNQNINSGLFSSIYFWKHIWQFL